MIAVGFGALIADIDEQHSWIGRRTRGVSDLMNMVFGHRGITHSLLGLVLVLIPILFAVGMTPLSFTNGMCIFAGYFLHLVEDSFSKKVLSGCCHYQIKHSKVDLMLFTTAITV